MEKKLLKKIVFGVLIVSILGAVILSVLVFKYPVLTIDIAATKFIQGEGSNPFEKSDDPFLFKRNKLAWHTNRSIVARFTYSLIFFGSPNITESLFTVWPP